jgi:hypothetical protein
MKSEEKLMRRCFLVMIYLFTGMLSGIPFIVFHWTSNLGHSVILNGVYFFFMFLAWITWERANWRVKRATKVDKDAK